MADQESTERTQLITRLQAYVTGDARTAIIPDAPYLGECVDEATALVGQAIGAVTTVPGEIRQRAIIEAASELFHRKQAPSGISQYAGPDGSALRMARDPMNGARAILAPFLPLGFA